MQGIKSVGIQNFQSHVETELSFHPGLNVITGDSDNGKSAILRAILWLVNNRPSGDSFKNWDAPLKETVAVEVSFDKHTISLSRESNKNSYVLNGGNPLSAIKTDVPQEVSELLNLSEYNVQTQHEGYFLLKESPGEVARKLNDLVGLDTIDLLYKNIGSKIKEINSDVRYLTNSQTSMEEELEKYEKLDDVKKLIEGIEKKDAEAAAFAATRYFIQLKLSQLKLIKEEREKMLSLTNSEKEIKGLLYKTNEYLLYKEKKRQLEIKIDTLNSILEDKEEGKSWIALGKLCQPILDRIQEVSALKNKSTKLKNTLLTIETLQRRIEETKNNYRKAVEKYIKLIKEVKVCPTCGTKLSEKKLHEIIINW